MKKKFLAAVLIGAAALGLASCDKDKPLDDTPPTSDVEGESGSTDDTNNSGNDSTNNGETVVKQFTVTFDSKGGSAIDAATVKENEKVSKPTNPTKENYTFAGWYTDEACTNQYNFDSFVTADIKLYAKWAEKLTVSFVLDGVKYVDSIKVDANGTISLPANPAGNELRTFAGWYTDEAWTKPFNAETPITEDLKLYAGFTYVAEDADGYALISTIAQLNTLRTSKDLTGKYRLVRDLDLTGVSLAATSAVLKGTFDGAGYRIKNATFIVEGNKMGILFGTIQGGTVKNLKFLSCYSEVKGESAGLITGLCEGGTFQDIEFSNCSVVASTTYCGLLYARNTSQAIINVEGITTKYTCTTSCSQYGGFLTGDMVKTSTLNVRNCYLDGEFKTSTGNGSFIGGRTRGSIVNVENVIVKAKLPQNQTGIFTSGGETSNGNVRNSVVLSAEGTNYPFTGKTKDTMAYDNVYAVEGVINDGTSLGITEVDLDSVTFEWYTTTLGLSTEIWENEEGTIKLKSSSTNIPSADAYIEKLILSTNIAKTVYYTGEEFSSDGLVVLASYSDGVQKGLTINDLDIDATAVSKDTTGTQFYDIVVSLKDNAEVYSSYTVKYRSEIALKVNTEFAKKVYLVGENFSATDVYGYAVLSDGAEILSSSVSVNSDNFDSSTPGSYEIVVSYKDFESVRYNVSVIAGAVAPVEDKIALIVDADAEVNYQGQLVNGHPTFNNLTDAMTYVNICKYDAAVEKVVYIMDGKYEEKVTVAADNVTLIGESKTGTVITYSAVEDTAHPSGKLYGLDCASLTVSGKNFTATNLSIRNDFDFINEAKNHASPQGLALTVNADKALLYNVVLYGNQDTLFLKNGRTYFKNSTIYGNIDFIFGEAAGISFFDTCEIQSIKRGDNQKNGGYITAMRCDASNQPDYGYVFYRCNFTAGEGVLDGSVSLGRPWGAEATVAYIECEFGKHIAKAAYGNTDKLQPRWGDMSGNSPVDANFVEYGCTGDGAISTAVAGGSILDATTAANYTVENVLDTTNGKQTFAGKFETSSRMATVDDYLKLSEDSTINLEESQDITIALGDSYSIQAFKEFNAANKSATFVSSDTEVCTVDIYGNVTSVASGDAVITVTIDGADYLVNVTVEEEEEADPELITKDVVLDFTTVDGLSTSLTTSKINYSEGFSSRHNGAESQLKGTISFKVPQGSVVSVTAYGNSEYVSYTIGAQGATDLETKKGNAIYTATSEGYVEIVCGDGNYLCRVDIDVPAIIKKSMTLDFTTADALAASLANTNVTYSDVSSRFNGAESQFSGTIGFNVTAGTTVSVVPYNDSRYVSYTLGVMGATDLVTQTGAYSFTATENCRVEYIGGSNNYVCSISVSVPVVIKKSMTLDFTTADALAESLANTNVTYSNVSSRFNNAETQFSGTISFNVTAGTTVSVVPYNGTSNVSYTLGVKGATDLETKNSAYSFTATEDCTVEYIGGSNNYLCSISVSVPVVIKKSMTLDFTTADAL
ncbi:MAG: hypothetical protein E7176_05570, partial [Erysipelotrichaceae bacterium]|nr:hypothetical protein [Erysipelotrichaceae bacterium]